MITGSISIIKIHEPYSKGEEAVKISVKQISTKEYIVPDIISDYQEMYGLLKIKKRQF